MAGNDIQQQISISLSHQMPASHLQQQRSHPFIPAHYNYETNNDSGSNNSKVPHLKMIGKALLSGPPQGMIVTRIYAYMKLHYPFLRKLTTDWRKAVRHALSLKENEFFVKGDRSNRGWFNW